MSDKYSRNHTGRRFSHLTMLQKIGANGSGIGATWSAKCDCGQVVEVTAKYVVSGRVKTCGKCRYHRDLLRRKTNRDVIYGELVSKAVQQGVQIDLSVEEFRNILKDGCGLCGEEGTKGDKAVSRLDHTKGYSESNCIALCKGCTRMVGRGTVPDLIQRMVRIVDRFRG